MGVEMGCSSTCMLKTGQACDTSKSFSGAFQTFWALSLFSGFLLQKLMYHSQSLNSSSHLLLHPAIEVIKPALRGILSFQSWNASTAQ